MTTPQMSEADEIQAATGEGYDPDQTWDDEPDEMDENESVDPADMADEPAVEEEDYS